MIKEDTTIAEAKLSFQSKTLRSISVSRLFHIDDVVQNGESVLSLGCHEWFSRLVRECKSYCCGSAAGLLRHQNLQYSAVARVI